MLLVVDVGNTNTVVGLYDGDDLAAHWRVVTTNYRTSDELRILFSMLLEQDGYDAASVHGCCISSVVPELNSALIEVARNGFNVEPIVVEPGIRTGIKLHNENPKELGADRLVNAVAAAEQYEGDKIVVDFGTATTFDFITAQAEYKGGIIIPGIQLSANALFENCAKLPRVEVTVPDHVIGRDTVTNIRSGLTYGYADMVEGLVRRISAETGATPYVIATGGLAAIIASVASCIDTVDPFLTMKGLRAIYRMNAKVSA